MINVSLEESLTLDEVVITGYGSQIKRELTGNIVKISGQDIEGVPVTRFESALQGRAAGVLVSQQNGKVGQVIKIQPKFTHDEIVIPEFFATEGEKNIKGMSGALLESTAVGIVLLRLLRSVLKP